MSPVWWQGWFFLALMVLENCFSEHFQDGLLMAGTCEEVLEPTASRQGCVVKGADKHRTATSNSQEPGTNSELGRVAGCFEVPCEKCTDLQDRERSMLTMFLATFVFFNLCTSSGLKCSSQVFQ